MGIYPDDKHRICNHHPETCSCNSKLDNYNVKLVKKKTKKVKQVKASKTINTVFNNDPCINCGSRATKTGRICSSCAF